ncbi:hypothetical protein [Pseudoalteromonas sp. H105]|uniref:hypothetical protein n=1 Tax=Pseudoalteromonas sp. H105 TaxID=1348393 RepID=UPI000731F281|nr:hypothetical protein [Pseudoalteromonas sp. H105]KTF12217.1 hypothetical protein ATS75_18425 [Pseudoalteromonas sp. H105]
MAKLFLEKDLKKMSRDSFFKKGCIYKTNGIFKFVVIDSMGNQYSILKTGTVQSRTFTNIRSIYNKILKFGVYEFSFIDNDRRKELSNEKAS